MDPTLNALLGVYRGTSSGLVPGTLLLVSPTSLIFANPTDCYRYTLERRNDRWGVTGANTVTFRPQFTRTGEVLGLFWDGYGNNEEVTLDRIDRFPPMSANLASMICGDRDRYGMVNVLDAMETVRPLKDKPKAEMHEIYGVWKRQELSYEYMILTPTLLIFISGNVRPFSLHLREGQWIAEGRDQNHTFHATVGKIENGVLSFGWSSPLSSANITFGTYRPHRMGDGQEWQQAAALIEQEAKTWDAEQIVSLFASLYPVSPAPTQPEPTPAEPQIKPLSAYQVVERHPPLSALMGLYANGDTTSMLVTPTALIFDPDGMSRRLYSLTWTEQGYQVRSIEGSAWTPTFQPDPKGLSIAWYSGSCSHIRYERTADVKLSEDGAKALMDNVQAGWSVTELLDALSERAAFRPANQHPTFIDLIGSWTSPSRDEQMIVLPRRLIFINGPTVRVYRVDALGNGSYKACSDTRGDFEFRPDGHGAGCTQIGWTVGNNQWHTEKYDPVKVPLTGYIQKHLEEGMRQWTVEDALQVLAAMWRPAEAPKEPEFEKIEKIDKEMEALRDRTIKVVVPALEPKPDEPKAEDYVMLTTDPGKLSKDVEDRTSDARTDVDWASLAVKEEERPVKLTIPPLLRECLGVYHHENDAGRLLLVTPRLMAFFSFHHLPAVYFSNQVDEQMILLSGLDKPKEILADQTWQSCSCLRWDGQVYSVKGDLRLNLTAASGLSGHWKCASQNWLTSYRRGRPGLFAEMDALLAWDRDRWDACDMIRLFASEVPVLQASGNLAPNQAQMVGTYAGEGAQNRVVITPSTIVYVANATNKYYGYGLSREGDKWLRVGLVESSDGTAPNDHQNQRNPVSFTVAGGKLHIAYTDSGCESPYVMCDMDLEAVPGLAKYLEMDHYKWSGAACLEMLAGYGNRQRKDDEAIKLVSKADLSEGVTLPQYTEDMVKQIQAQYADAVKELSAAAQAVVDAPLQTRLDQLAAGMEASRNAASILLGRIEGLAKAMATSDVSQAIKEAAASVEQLVKDHGNAARAAHSLIQKALAETEDGNVQRYQDVVTVLANQFQAASQAQDARQTELRRHLDVLMSAINQTAQGVALNLQPLFRREISETERTIRTHVDIGISDVKKEIADVRKEILAQRETAASMERIKGHSTSGPETVMEGNPPIAALIGVYAEGDNRLIITPSSALFVQYLSDGTYGKVSVYSLDCSGGHWRLSQRQRRDLPPTVDTPSSAYGVEIDLTDGLKVNWVNSSGTKYPHHYWRGTLTGAPSGLLDRIYGFLRDDRSLWSVGTILDLATNANMWSADPINQEDYEAAVKMFEGSWSGGTTPKIIDVVGRWQHWTNPDEYIVVTPHCMYRRKTDGTFTYEGCAAHGSCPGSVRLWNGHLVVSVNGKHVPFAPAIGVLGDPNTFDRISREKEKWYGEELLALLERGHNGERRDPPLLNFSIGKSMEECLKVVGEVRQIIDMTKEPDKVVATDEALDRPKEPNEERLDPISCGVESDTKTARRSRMAQVTVNLNGYKVGRTLLVLSALSAVAWGGTRVWDGMVFDANFSKYLASAKQQTDSERAGKYADRALAYLDQRGMNNGRTDVVLDGGPESDLDEFYQDVRRAVKQIKSAKSQEDREKVEIPQPPSGMFSSVALYPTNKGFFAWFLGTLLTALAGGITFGLANKNQQQNA